MEMWQGLSYDAILTMPYTRRQRLMAKKDELEKKRASRSK
jgi:hypothetical protein